MTPGLVMINMEVGIVFKSKELHILRAERVINLTESASRSVCRGHNLRDLKEYYFMTLWTFNVRLARRNLNSRFLCLILIGDSSSRRITRLPRIDEAQSVYFGPTSVVRQGIYEPVSYGKCN